MREIEMSTTFSVKKIWVANPTPQGGSNVGEPSKFSCKILQPPPVHALKWKHLSFWRFFLVFYGVSLTLQSLFFWQKKARIPEKSEDFPLCETLDILAKESKTHKKQGKLQNEKSEENEKKQGLEGRGFRVKIGHFPFNT